MSKKIVKAVAVDDEIHCLKTLEFELSRTCPSVELVAQFQNASEAKSYLNDAEIDVLFLDIHLQTTTGIALLEELMPVPYEVIFVTAYDEYAIKAFDLSATHYLLKPINKDKLKIAVDKVIESKKGEESGKYARMLAHLKQSISGSEKVGIPVQDGVEFVNPNMIIYVMADSNYSTLYFTNGKKLTVSKTLKLVEENYLPSNFLRIHKSHIINLKELTKYIKNDGGYVIMSDGKRLEVSRSKRQLMNDLY